MVRVHRRTNTAARTRRPTLTTNYRRALNFMHSTWSTQKDNTSHQPLNNGSQLEKKPEDTELKNKSPKPPTSSRLFALSLQFRRTSSFTKVRMLSWLTPIKRAMFKPVAAGLLTARAMAAKASYPHEDEYTSLNDLKIKIDGENGAFFMCFWMYILSSTTPPATIIRQIYTDIEGNVPLLVLNKEKKMMLFPFMYLLEKAPRPGDSASWSEVPCASTEIECPFNRWVHVGCEVSLKSVRLYMDGVLEGEKSLLSSLRNDSNLKDASRITLRGADAENGTVHGYVHYVRFILPQKCAIQDHIIKNPPIELSIDTSGITEIEEDEDGVWSIIGGKASCRRNFNLDVVLLDGLGHPVNKEMEVVASLIYADNGVLVEKPSDAEAPLLTTYDGIEFASFLKPSKVLHGRASFKLKISQLSSKCENRLFRVRFDVPKTRRYRFLEAYTNPIRCVSRSRSTRTSSVVCKKSSSAAHILDEPQLLGVHDGSPELEQNNGDEHLTNSTIPESKCSSPPKRVKMGAELSGRVQPDGRQHDGCNSHYSNTVQAAYVHGEGVKGKVENLEGTDNTPSDSESIQARDPALEKVTSTRNPIPDLTIFKYCLGSMYERSLILKEVATFATDQEMTNFAQQVSLYTGCSHHRYPITIAKRLLQEGSDAWDLIAQGNGHVLWESAVVEIGEQFKRISRCSTRGLLEQDFELLQRIAGCQGYMTREKFDKMWCWLYPVAFTLSREGISAIWACMSTLWIEGLITKEEAESSLQSGRISHQPGTFVLRFPTSRSWPHPDAGSLIVTYVGHDFNLHHRLLSLDYREMKQKSLEELLLEEPHLMRMGRVLAKDYKL